MPVTLREATPDDAKAIADCNAAMAQETEARVLESARLGAGVAALLDDERKGRYWVAESDGHIVGQIMVTYEWSDWRNATIWWIQSVYVHPEHRRRGIFTALYRHVEDIARRAENVCGLRLYVEKANRRAQETYTALGMSQDSYLVMESMFRE